MVQPLYDALGFDLGALPQDRHEPPAFGSVYALDPRLLKTLAHHEPEDQGEGLHCSDLHSSLIPQLSQMMVAFISYRSPCRV